jgi:hypothetical protein
MDRVVDAWCAGEDVKGSGYIIIGLLVRHILE